MATDTNQSNKEIIERLLSQEKNLFPKAKPIDYYKVVFQAFRGPSHFISENSLNFLREEIYLTNINKYPILVDISGFHKLWRVNVNVVTDGIISLEDYADAHFNTCREEQSDEIRWLEFWKMEEGFFCEYLNTLQILRPEPGNNGILDFTVAISHSDSYHKYYTPHYRLINPMLLPSEVVKEIKLLSERR